MLVVFASQDDERATTLSFALTRKRNWRFVMVRAPIELETLLGPDQPALILILDGSHTDWAIQLLEQQATTHRVPVVAVVPVYRTEEEEDRLYDAGANEVLTWSDLLTDIEGNQENLEFWMRVALRARD